MPLPFAALEAMRLGIYVGDAPPGPDTCESVKWGCPHGHTWTMCNHGRRHVPPDVLNGERCPFCPSDWLVGRFDAADH